MQFTDYVRRAATGDLGRSYRSGEAVTAVIARALPYTVALTTAGLMIAVLIGIPVGVVSAFWQNSVWDHLLSGLALLGLSMPVFWLGTMMQWYFSFDLRWLPTAGSGTWRHLVMPALSVGIYTAANFVRMLRATIVDILREDFVRTIYAKGLGRLAGPLPCLAQCPDSRRNDDRFAGGAAARRLHPHRDGVRLARHRA